MRNGHTSFNKEVMIIATENWQHDLKERNLKKEVNNSEDEGNTRRNKEKKEVRKRGCRRRNVLFRESMILCI